MSESSAVDIQTMNQDVDVSDIRALVMTPVKLQGAVMLTAVQIMMNF